MRRLTKDILISVLLVVGAVVCIVRWQAWFGMPEEPFWPNENKDYTFPGPEITNPKSELTILVLGDIHNRLTKADYDSLAARVPDIDLIAQVGDWMERGQNFYYQSLIREWTDSELNGTPVIACPGNHEYSKGLHKKLSPVWEQAFSYPHNGPVGVPGATYYVDLPQMRIIAIDTNPLKRLVYLTRTLTWLHKTMDSADDRYIVVLMHHPVISAGKGRFNTLIYCTFRHALEQADLVIAGHDHSYMRKDPFVVLNTAGRTKKQRANLHAAVSDTVPVYGVLKISNFKSQISNLQFNVYRLDDNTLIDSLYVSRD
jgi:hypothetical protein